MRMQVTFDEPKTLTVVPQTRKRPAVTKEFTKVTIMAMIDFPDARRVVVHTLEAGQQTLWQGDAYDAAGQWTDEDVIDAIKAL